MLETEDPRAAIGAKDLPTQAAAARDLARMGTWEDVEGLLELATSHKRTGLRLSAAAAAADILHRYRTGAMGEPLGPERTRIVLDWSRRTDPGHNPSSLMLLAAIPERSVLDRLGRLLRDPRVDVRAGAAVTVRRMALSHTDLAPAALRRAFGTWLAHRKTPGDARVELIRLIGDLGWTEHREAVLDARGASEPLTEAATTALERLDAREDPAAWSGLYLSDGLDVLEQDLEPRPGSLLLVHGAHLVHGPHPSEAPLPGVVSADLEDGLLHADALPAPARLVWAPRVGQPERTRAIQVPGTTWFRLEGKALVAFLEAHPDLLGEPHRPATGALLATLAEPEGAVEKRGRVIAHLLHGEAEAAREQLVEMTAGKRPRNELFAWLGRAEEALGNERAALGAYRTYLEKAKKKEPLRPHAEARAEALDG
jgi:hypothetical protein